jgi:hypothetical protein
MMDKKVLPKGRGHTCGQTNSLTLAMIRIKGEAGGLGSQLTIEPYQVFAINKDISVWEIKFNL